MALGWLWWRARVPVDAVAAAAVCVAGVVLGDIERRFCVAGVALGDIYVHSAWQAWHLWHWAGSAERRALGSQLTPWPPRLLAWQAWYLATSSVDSAWQVRHLATCTYILGGKRGTWRHRASILCGRCGTWRHRASILRGRRDVAGAAVCVAGVVLGDIERRFCVAGAALGDMYVHSAWQAWHLWHWAGSGGALGSQLTPWPPRLFAWQAWYLATSSIDSAWQVRHLATDVHSAWQVLGDIERAFCVAGVALMIMALGWLWWRARVPVDAVAAAAVCVAGMVLGDIERRFCVAGVALGDMYVHSAWQAWHLWHWAGSGPSPSLFSFLHSPWDLYLSFAACWKKLTCGVIRSFNLSR